ncbi:NifB/NifX family molybdenum-iron cluster-binding protein [Plebeiibacterium sediminum]|uniref:NifB/NifX family molybdenum-iron cluster-binding protein n=1 Tax=Plebeiibacterium sediminum TaxID=2992112 RepID=A0AAE3M5U7_9BACT|nr:NifB/NifX family molybdenum-iron cluster-binding protein [Plebeiobacterium sediminum]MCW3787724.1 NifB/NifX family molybdenum-iron cluster-binding protein [Plebeiobacterium sediminum]
MKTVITSTGNSLGSDFDLRFGRAAWFCLHDEESGECTFIENVNADDSNGAGLKVSERMVELGVGKVISGDFGPKAKDLLDKFNIQMVILQNEGATIQNILDKLK